MDLYLQNFLEVIKKEAVEVRELGEDEVHVNDKNDLLLWNRLLFSA